MNNIDSNTPETKWGFYKAGWRPALGWLSVLIVFYSFIIHPVILWIVIFKGITITPPVIDATALLNLVAIIIGVGAMRSYEKVNSSFKSYGSQKQKYEEYEVTKPPKQEAHNQDIYNKNFNPPKNYKD